MTLSDSARVCISVLITLENGLAFSVTLAIYLTSASAALSPGTVLSASVISVGHFPKIFSRPELIFWSSVRTSLDLAFSCDSVTCDYIWELDMPPRVRAAGEYGTSWGGASLCGQRMSKSSCVLNTCLIWLAMYCSMFLSPDCDQDRSMFSICCLFPRACLSSSIGSTTIFSSTSVILRWISSNALCCCNSYLWSFSVSDFTKVKWASSCSFAWSCAC